MAEMTFGTSTNIGKLSYDTTNKIFSFDKSLTITDGSLKAPIVNADKFMVNGTTLYKFVFGTVTGITQGTWSNNQSKSINLSSNLSSVAGYILTWDPGTASDEGRISSYKSGTTIHFLGRANQGNTSCKVYYIAWGTAKS